MIFPDISSIFSAFYANWFYDYLNFNFIAAKSTESFFILYFFPTYIEQNSIILAIASGNGVFILIEIKYVSWFGRVQKL